MWKTQHLWKGGFEQVRLIWTDGKCGGETREEGKKPLWHAANSAYRSYRVCDPVVNFISQCSLLALCGFQVTHDISNLNKNHLLGTFYVQLH